MNILILPFKGVKTHEVSKWQQIPWPRVKERVVKLQGFIYSASKAGDIKRVRKFQHLLVNSYEAKLLAIRRATQDNTGKKTAGVDKARALTPKQRLELASSLRIPTQSSPLRRVWIPKPGTDVMRPLGIPTIKDRCLQALFKLMLEPEWEAKFEPSSFGFRPGRSCRDALAAIQANIQKRSKYVLDADIAKCFDRINHKALLDKIGMTGGFGRQLLAWLKAGVLDGSTFSETDLGTPQGGIVSPVLANIALHRMEDHLKKFVCQFPMTYASGTVIKKSRRGETVTLIRYADDFVVLHHDKKILLACKAELVRWLGEMGLEFSPTKTRLTHTLELQSDDVEAEGFDGTVGFVFLGYQIKQFASKYGSAKSTAGIPLGYKTLIFASAKARKKHQDKLHELIIATGKGLGQLALIKVLNPVIRGWSNYFGAFESNTTGVLTKMDYLMYLKLRKWASRKTGSANTSTRYWVPTGKSKWNFGVKNGPMLVKHYDFSTPSSKILRLKGEESPYSPNREYWLNQQRVRPGLSSRKVFLLKKQKGRCNWCGCLFRWDDIEEVDHIIPRHAGGLDKPGNLQLLHRHCHHRKTALESKYKSNQPVPDPSYG
uniref:RT-Mat-Endo n=2 Tax=Chlamydomonas TaxID=3052 RepID=U5I1X2_9CHLO|nr:reverse transcriptase/HNH endonuclease [Chlamydomonas sp. CCMP1619]AFU83032.1 RT-Mat-Endo [Chlamydomonas raudensis]